MSAFFDVILNYVTCACASPFWSHQQLLSKAGSYLSSARKWIVFEAGFIAELAILSYLSRCFCMARSKDVIPVKTSETGNSWSSVLYWGIYPCVWVYLRIRSFISHLHQEQSGIKCVCRFFTRVSSFYTCNALSTSDISARHHFAYKQ